MKLKQMNIKTQILNHIAEVEVEQCFGNDLEQATNVVYQFPLPENSAVYESVIEIGKRKIVSQIKERKEARKIFEKAQEQGKVASLIEQERPNLFTQNIANMQPKQEIKVTIKFLQQIKRQDNTYTYVHPLTMMPKFVPHGVEDTKKVTTLFSLKRECVADFEIVLNPGKKPTKIKSKSHKINVKEDKILVKKARRNKDFILTYNVTEKEISDAVITQNAGKEKFFMAVIHPPEKIDKEKVLPKEMIFVIDDSGSMSGWPIEKAKETMKHCIKNMNKDDTFQLISFSNDMIKVFEAPRKNTEENVEQALQFLVQRYGNGGTQMVPAVREALGLPYDKDRLRIVCFMSDCAIGNEFEVIEEIKARSKHARFFVFGVGYSSNRYLTEKMAEEGRGEILYVTTDDDAKQAAKKFYSMIANPLLKNIQINMAGAEIYPKMVNDLFSNKPVVVYGKTKKDGILVIKADGFEKKIKIKFSKKKQGSAISMLWARKHIAKLMSEDYIAHHARGLNKELEAKITKIALKYHLMSQYTSLVAVDTEKGEKAVIDAEIGNEVPQDVDPVMAGARVGVLSGLHACRKMPSSGKFYRLRRWQNRSSTPIERKLRMQLSKVSRKDSGRAGLGAIFGSEKYTEYDRGLGTDIHERGVTIGTHFMPYGEFGITLEDLRTAYSGTKYKIGTWEDRANRCIGILLRQTKIVSAMLNLSIKEKEELMLKLGEFIKQGRLRDKNMKILVAVAMCRIYEKNNVKYDMKDISEAADVDVEKIEKALTTIK